jgi:hypothetical protein
MNFRIKRWPILNRSGTRLAILVMASAVLCSVMIGLFGPEKLSGEAFASEPVELGDGIEHGFILTSAAPFVMLTAIVVALTEYSRGEFESD